MQQHVHNQVAIALSQFGISITFEWAHQGIITHTCVGGLVTTGSVNGLSPVRHKTITWADYDFVSTWPGSTFRWNFNRNSNIFSCRKCIWKCRLQNTGHFVPASECYGWKYPPVKWGLVWLPEGKSRVGPISLTIVFAHVSNSMENRIYSIRLLAMRSPQMFCTCHDSCAVVACAKICSDHFIRIWMSSN